VKIAGFAQPDSGFADGNLVRMKSAVGIGLADRFIRGLIAVVPFGHDVPQLHEHLDERLTRLVGDATGNGCGTGQSAIVGVPPYAVHMTAVVFD
jgi:hypothetical protein